MSEFKKVKIERGVYDYRGRHCRVNERYPSGYWGRWQSGKLITSSLAKLMDMIDRDIESSESA